MSVKRKLTLRLIAWLTAVGLVLFAMTVVSLVWTFTQLNRLEASRQFESTGLSELVRTLRKEGDRLRFDPKMLELVRESGGWLQHIDENGRVTESFHTPEDVPDSYGPGELISYWLGNAPFPYQLYLWIQEKDGVTHTLLYGRDNREEDWLPRIVAGAVVKGNEISVDEGMRGLLTAGSSWVQLLDAEGKEIASFNKPAGALSGYNVQEMALRSVYPDRYGAKLVAYFDASSGLTWVLNTPNPGTEAGSRPAWIPEMRVLTVGIGSLMLAATLLFVLVSFGLGNRFGAPVGHVLKWLKLLGDGHYEEPAAANGRPASLNRKGRRKNNYRVYQDVFDSMEALTGTLHRNEKLREETERMRDEWIAGVSHDLKTPLSSIKGYAHLLAGNEYEWTREEIRSFAEIMLEKSSYLDDLIDDLALTYRIKNGLGAPSSEIADLNAIAADAVGEASNHPEYKEGSVRFIPATAPCSVSVYRPWFHRIVDNLVANALLHNEPGTVLTISVLEDEPGIVKLVFRDDGSGMDEETAARLFERYYRGTDTEALAVGSGLGMAVTKALTEGLGGTIGVETGPGQGTTIVLAWPEIPEIRE